jgi:hypothetical protein
MKTGRSCHGSVSGSTKRVNKEDEPDHRPTYGAREECILPNLVWSEPKERHGDWALPRTG